MNVHCLSLFLYACARARASERERLREVNVWNTASRSMTWDRKFPPQRAGMFFPYPHTQTVLCEERRGCVGRESEREGIGEVAGKFPMIDTTLLLALPAVDMVLRGGTQHSTSFSLHAVQQNPVCSMSVHRDCVYFK